MIHPFYFLGHLFTVEAETLDTDDNDILSNIKCSTHADCKMMQNALCDIEEEVNDTDNEKDPTPVVSVAKPAVLGNEDKDDIEEENDKKK